MDAIEARVRGCITQVLSPKKVRLTADSSLVQSGLLDSLAVASLAAGLEQEFGINIPEDELGIDNVESVAALGRLVRSHLTAH